MLRKNRPHRRDQRREDAETRQRAYNKLSDTEKYERAGTKQKEKLNRKTNR